MVTVPFWIWYKTDTYAGNKNDTIRLTIPMPRSQDKQINWKRGSDTTPWQFLCKPIGYWPMGTYSECQRFGYWHQNIIKTIEKNRPTNLLNDITDWKIEEINGQKTIFYKGKNYIPRDQKLQCNIVKIFHDHETAGHPGKLETYNSVKVHYWWPGMHMFIKNYIQGCSHCQQFKINCSPAKPAYQPIAGAKTLVPLQTALWTWLRISHLSMAMTQSWLW